MSLPAAVRWLAEALVRLYYPERTVLGHEHLPPPSAPVIFVLNHPNGLLDPLVLRLAVGRRARFLAKNTLFGNPLGRLAMTAFGSIPVYRAKDASVGSDRGAANEVTFARCRELLARGEALALFPEGVSHSDPQLKPLKTGAARLALSAAAAGVRDLLVVPVGLAYEDKAIFRSRVLLVAGRPLAVADRLPAYRADERAAVDTLTEDIRAALDEVVLQAESRDLLEGVARVAAWTAPREGAAPDLVVQHRRTRDLLAAYRTLNARQPERVEPIVRAAREYERVLRHLGVRDPWALEYEPVRPAAALAAIARLLLAAPVALVGAALGWIPYRLAGQVARRVAPDEDVLGTTKLLAGALFVLLFWLIAVVAVGVTAGPGWGALVLLVAPPAGYVALRFEELWAEMKESVRHLWLRRRRAGEVHLLAAQRRQLADQITNALADAAP